MSSKLTIVNRESIIEQIQREDNLLSFPLTLSQILREIEKEDVNVESLAKIIKRDPSLASKVLKMANSAFYRRFTKSSTISQAVSVLGITKVVCLALSSSVFRPEISTNQSGIDMAGFYSHVLSVATACQRLAEETARVSGEEAFVVGLLNDIGLTLFLNHYPEYFLKVHEYKKNGCRSLAEAERKVFGIDHYEVSALLVERWQLPKTIADSVGHHGKKIENGQASLLQDILQLAMNLNPDKFSGFEGAVEDRLIEINRLTKRLSISREKVDQISSNLTIDTIENAAHFGIDIGSVEDILTKANQEICKAYFTIENFFSSRQELNRQILQEEHARGALESRNSSMATLFHYINNAAMAIYGRSQLLRNNYKSGQNDKLMENLERCLDVIDKSVCKIAVVLEEVKKLKPREAEKLCGSQEALNLDEKLARRLAQGEDDQVWFNESGGKAYFRAIGLPKES